MLTRLRSASETQKRRLFLRRMFVVHAVFLFLLLLIVARLLELQVVRSSEFHVKAQGQHFRGVILPARRGEILGRSGRTGETNILATNTTLDLVYVDPLITDDPALVSETLSDILVTEEFHASCSKGSAAECPRELLQFYAAAFDPLLQHALLHSGALLEPLPVGDSLPPKLLKLPDIAEVRRLFARSIEERTRQKRVTFVPLKYNATKVQMTAVAALELPGIDTDREENLIYANPEEIPQGSVDMVSERLATPLRADPAALRPLLRSRALRYVPVMRKLPPFLSLRIKEAQLHSLKEAIARRKPPSRRRAAAEELQYPLRSIALIPEHWRFYPDGTVASHVVGFVNTNQEPQYGVERTFNPQLRGQEGLIDAVQDEAGGPIQAGNRTVVHPRDGDTIVLTIDRTVQKHIEGLLADAVRKFRADSGQAIVMDPFTGRVIAMANAPLFDANAYAHVYEKEVILLSLHQEQQVLAEIIHPDTNIPVVRAFKDEVLTASGRVALPQKVSEALSQLEQLYDLTDLARYYMRIGENVRREIFPTRTPGAWLKFKNDIGVGAYLNRAIQEIYEPGSVMKPITMAIAIDKGEVAPGDTYNDAGPLKVDEYTIKNALFRYYGTVTMTNCLEFSINTCMTSVSEKLGPRLFRRELERFGFGRITGIELEDELSGDLPSWQDFRTRALLATSAFGQGISSTPLQVASAWAALANGGKLLQPTIVDSIVHADGTVEELGPRVVDQVITKQTSETITAMLVSSVEKGFAKPGKVPGYRIAGKTGTSQIAGPGGRYEEGSGSTIATYAGYAPVDRARFVILVKIDRPKSTIYGVEAAAPLFRQIAAFLFKYYGIPPDDGVR